MTLKYVNDYRATNWISALVTGVFVSSCLVGLVFLQKPFLGKTREMSTEEYIQQQTLKGTQLNLLKKSPSLGFRNLIANWAYLNFIQYYGDFKAREKTDYSLVPDYFQIVVDRDPRFITAYFLLEPANSLFAGQPQTSVDLINQGLQFVKPEMPMAYQLWMYKAIDEVLFLGENKEAENSYRQAVKWAKIENSESSLIGAMKAEESANFLATNPDSKSARASAWMMILGNARDDATRQIALDNLEKLGAKVTITPNSISVSMPKDENK